MREPTELEYNNIQKSSMNGHHIIYLEMPPGNANSPGWFDNKSTFSGWFRTMTFREYVRYSMSLDTDEMIARATYLGHVSDIFNKQMGFYSAIADNVYQTSNKISDENVHNLTSKIMKNPILQSLVSGLLLSNPTYSELLNMPIMDVLILFSSLEFASKTQTNRPKDPNNPRQRSGRNSEIEEETHYFVNEKYKNQ